VALIVDSYSESNYDDAEVLYTGGDEGEGQSFTGDGGTLSNVKFYLSKKGSPTGNSYAKIYAHTGTFGTSSLPTGSALATSGAFEVSDIATPYVFELITFTFTGADKVTLTNGTKYVVTFEWSGGDINNWVYFGRDASSPTHDGNMSHYASETWYAYSTRDACFYVYKDESTTTRQYVSPGIFMER